MAGAIPQIHQFRAASTSRAPADENGKIPISSAEAAKSKEKVIRQLAFYLLSTGSLLFCF